VRGENGGCFAAVMVWGRDD